MAQLNQMHAHMVKLFAEVNHTLKIQSKLLHNIIKKKDGVSVPELPDGAEFPLKTEEELQSMNTKLRDTEFKTAVVSSNHVFTSPPILL